MQSLKEFSLSQALDRPLKEGDVISLVGQAASGKTALALVLANDASNKGWPVKYFSNDSIHPELAKKAGITKPNIFIEPLPNPVRFSSDIFALNHDNTLSFVIIDWLSSAKDCGLGNPERFRVMAYIQYMAKELGMPFLIVDMVSGRGKNCPGVTDIPSDLAATSAVNLIVNRAKDGSILELAMYKDNNLDSLYLEL